MSDEDTAKLARENAYLKQRVAQLEGDVSDLSAQVTRLSERLERGVFGRIIGNPLSGGQSG